MQPAWQTCDLRATSWPQTASLTQLLCIDAFALKAGAALPATELTVGLALRQGKGACFIIGHQFVELASIHGQARLPQGQGSSMEQATVQQGYLNDKGQAWVKQDYLKDRGRRKDSSKTTSRTGVKHDQGQGSSMTTSRTRN